MDSLNTPSIDIVNDRYMRYSNSKGFLHHVPGLCVLSVHLTYIPYTEKILLSVLLQVCVCQNCPLIPDRGQKEGALMARVGQETSLPYNKTERPPSFNQSLPRMTPAIRSLIPQAASADEMARSTFGRRMPSTARLCPQIRKDIIIGSWIFYRGLFCYVPPPFSGYRFFNIHCPCCKPCFFPSNVCGLYFCIPSLKRSYLFPAYCWRLPFFQRFGWRIIRFHTFHVCSCVNVLRIG